VRREPRRVAARPPLTRRPRARACADALGWLYACRGLYQLREFHLVIDGLRHCLRHEKTRKQAQHLLAFSLLHTEQPEAAAAAFAASVKLANDTDWQMLVELCIEFPSLSLATPQPAQQPAHAPEEPV
jgi:hypothetical protein